VFDDKQIARFWRKVNFDGPTVYEHLGPCWIYSGGMQGGLCGAYRFSYELAYGSVSVHLWILHKCDNRRCVRPDHLFVGSASDNMQDAAAKGRLGSGGNRAALMGEQVTRARLAYPGLSIGQIATELGVSDGVVKAAVFGTGAYSDSRMIHTEEQVQQILRMYADGQYVGVIARQLGASFKAVQEVLRGFSICTVPPHVRPESLIC
jgi:hypothetical protein